MGPQNVFPFVTTHLKKPNERRKKRYAKGLLDLPASIRAANDSAHSNHPDDFGFPKISSRVVVVFYRRSKRISSRFLSSGCLTRVQNPRAGHTGRVRARERMRKESNLIDWVMQNAVAWVRARAIGRECAVARRCRRRCFGRRSIFRTYFKGPKKGEGGASVLPNLFVRGGGGVCLLARTNVVGAARCFGDAGAGWLLTL